MQGSLKLRKQSLEPGAWSEGSTCGKVGERAVLLSVLSLALGSVLNVFVWPYLIVPHFFFQSYFSLFLLFTSLSLLSFTSLFIFYFLSRSS